MVVYGFATMLPRAGQRMNYLKLAWDWLRTPRFNPLDLTSSNRSVMGFNLSYMFEQTHILDRSMARLLELADAGVLRPPSEAQATSARPPSPSRTGRWRQSVR